MGVKLLQECHLEFPAQACLSLHLSKCHIVGNHMSQLISDPTLVDLRGNLFVLCTNEKVSKVHEGEG